jgi:hypothetical protein
MVHLKYCSDCADYRPTTEFTRDRRRKDGLAFYCTTHARVRMRESRRRRLGEPKRRYPVDQEVLPGEKWCPDCETVKPTTEFPRTRNSASGIYTYCKPCHNIRGKAAKDKIGGSRTYHLKRRYGISAEDADAMLEGQGGLCAICRRAPAAHVDHDHETGAVRALLCFNCNGGLGQFKDDPLILRAAADYVEEHRRRQRAKRARPLSAKRQEVVGRPGRPPVGSRRGPDPRPAWLCSRGRAILAAREASA